MQADRPPESSVDAEPPTSGVRWALARVPMTSFMVVGAFAAVHVLFLLLPGIFATWNDRTVDQLYVLRTRVPWCRLRYDATVVNVGLGDRTMAQFAETPLHRGHYAQVMANLGEMHTALQAWDMILPERMTPAEDQALVAAAEKAGNVMIGMVFSGLQRGLAREEPGDPNPARAELLRRTTWEVEVRGDGVGLYRGVGPATTFADLVGACTGLGFLNVTSDRDGAFRRLPLLVRYGDGVYPSLALRAACACLRVTTDRIRVVPGKHILLRGAEPPGRAPRDIRIPIDTAGNMLVNYLGPWEAMEYRDFGQVLEASDDQDELALWREKLAGKVVVVSVTATGAGDAGTVPTDRHMPLGGLHANAIHGIITEQFLRELPAGGMALVELALGVVLVAMALRLRPLGFAVGALGLVAGYLIAAGGAFLAGQVVLNIVRPAVGMVLGSAAVMAWRLIRAEKQKEVLRRSFEAYFPPGVVRRVMARPDLVTSGGQKKELTILFSDIKDFTPGTADLAPDAIQRLLNEYFDAMVEIVFRHGGTVDKFMGDGLMVFFGDPEPQPDHALRCVRAALEMQVRAKRLHGDWARRGGMPLAVRIGISTGVAVVGNMGSARRLSYTALGAAVNLAKRLEASAPPGGILISERTNTLVTGQLPTRALGRIPVKGFAEAVPVYEVMPE